MERKLDLDWLRDLKGQIPGSNVKIEEVNEFNTSQICSRITDVCKRTYFRYFKVHIHRLCQLRANAKNCDDDLCVLDKAPSKGGGNKENELGDIKPMKRNNGPQQTSKWEVGECDTCYCINLEQETEDMTFFDLVYNTEQFTGFEGAHLWNIIYNSIEDISGDDSKNLIFRSVSGLHSSVNVHLSYKFVQPTDQQTNIKVESIVRPNPQELAKRFHPSTTDNRGPSWARNLYFAYLVVLRGITEGEKFWKALHIDTGDKQADADTKSLLLSFLEVAKSCVGSLGEEKMSLNPDLQQLFMVYFQNISGVFDHITCERCRLWGKIQIIGIRTAFKILFDASKISGKGKGEDEEGGMTLTQAEVVSLFNTLGRLSESIRFLGEFERMKEAAVGFS